MKDNSEILNIIKEEIDSNDPNRIIGLFSALIVNCAKQLNLTEDNMKFICKIMTDKFNEHN